jgi:hypothetical protein
VIVAQELLQTMGLRAFTPMVTACPGCGRTTSTFFQELAGRGAEPRARKMPEWKISHPGVENMTLAVMGCVVNGPGESKHANIGISLPGTGEAPAAPVFVDGEKPVPPGRRRGAGLRGAGHRCRGHPDVAPACGTTSGSTASRCRSTRSASPTSARRHRAALIAYFEAAHRLLDDDATAPPAQQPAAHPRQQEPGHAGTDRRRAPS